MVPKELIIGTIFDIQGFSVHDGPGCRTLIFFKGCSLQCAWCSNPEGLSFFPEPLYRETKCTFDHLCMEACPHGAISVASNGNVEQLSFVRERCAKCTTYDCAKSCYSGALNIGGYEISVEDLYSRISRDRQFWGDGGGITLTGGEPFAQPEFAAAFLERCYGAYIHTAVETCGNVPWENYQAALPFIDWIFFDLKTMNESPTDFLTGPPVRLSACSPVPLILANARRLSLEFKGRLVFRLPLVPGFNDDAENLHQTATFIKSTGRDEINILPLHHMGREKYRLLGREYFTTDFKTPASGDLQKAASLFHSYGIKCYTGSETPF
ncbi:MAG: glycyl-radical enzyme activating protein [bacterium]